MRICKILFTFLLVFSFFGVNSYALEADEAVIEYENLLPEGAPPLSDMEGLISSSGPDKILSEIVSAIGGGVSEVLSFFVLVTLSAGLISLAGSLNLFESEESSKLSCAAVGCVFSVLIFAKLFPVVNEVRVSLSEASDFFASAIPVLSAINASSGGIKTAATQAFNMNLCLSIVSFLSSKLLLPLSFAFFSLSLVGGFEFGTVSVLSKKVKNVFLWCMGILTAVFLGVTSLQNVISSTQDSAYMRAAKYAASGMIPIVGSTVSSSLGTLAGGFSYIRSTVGVSFVIVMLSFFLSPLIMLLLYKFSLGLAASFMEFTSPSGARIFSGFGGALDAVISVYAFSAVVYLAEILIFIKSGVNVFG